MKLLKRVFISVTRRKTASLVILLIAFLMGNVMAVAITIQQSSVNIQRNLLEKAGGRLEIYPKNLSNESDARTLDDYEFESNLKAFYENFKNIGNYSSIAYMDYSLHFSGIEVDENQSIELDETYRFEKGHSVMNGIENKELIDEKEKYIQFSKGSLFTDEQMENGENVLLVSENVRLNNQIVQPDDIIYFKIRGDDELIPYKVVGTFKVIDNKYSDVKNIHNISMFYTPNQNIRNMYEKYLEANKNERFKMRYWVDKATFVVGNSEELENMTGILMDMSEEKKNFTYSSTLDQMSDLIKPIKKLSSTSEDVLLFSMIAMTFVLGVVSFYFIRDRKREIGIYLSLGIRKIHLVFQIVLESLLTGMFAIFLSIGSGWLISQSYSSSLIRNSMKEQQNSYEQFFGDVYEMDEEEVEDYTVVIEKDHIVMLICLSFSTILLSTSFPLIYIIRLNPKEIMLD